MLLRRHLLLATFLLFSRNDVANSVGNEIANFAQKLGSEDPQKNNNGEDLKSSKSDHQRRSTGTHANSAPIDLLMDHEVDFIEDQIDWKWCLLAISGNATIVKLRRNDFVKYLKMNVASLVGSEYDLVRVTSISYTPYVLVNVSLDWSQATEPRILKSLGGLASHNDTLLDLSGEHFNLTDFLPSSALLSPKALSPLEERDAAAAAADPRQLEAMIYLVIGATMAFLVTATLIYSVCHCLNKSATSGGGQASSKLTAEDELDLTLRSRTSSRQTFNRQSYLQQSPMTEETISLEDFEGRSGPGFHRTRSVPKLIYTQEFSQGLKENGHTSQRQQRLLQLRAAAATPNDAKDDSLAPLATFDGDENCVPHQFVLRRSISNHHQFPHHHRPLLPPRPPSSVALQLHTEQHQQPRGQRYNMQPGRPLSEMIMASSPMSEIHPRSIMRNGSTGGGTGGIPPRPSSVLEDPSYFPPLSPPPDFHSGYMSDVPSSKPARQGQRYQSSNGGRRHSSEHQPLVLSSFRPTSSFGIPSISQPTPEEIQRDVDIVFHNMGLDSQSSMTQDPNAILSVENKAAS